MENLFKKILRVICRDHPLPHVRLGEVSLDTPPPVTALRKGSFIKYVTQILPFKTPLPTLFTREPSSFSATPPEKVTTHDKTPPPPPHT